MSTLGAGTFTLLDLTQRLDPNGKIARIGEVLTQRNPILMDMQWKEGNLLTGHQTTIRSGLPAVAWRSLNRGIPKSKSTTAQVTETCGKLEAISEIDVDEANLGGNPMAVRLSENNAFLQAMNIEMASNLFYGNIATEKASFNGLSHRFSDSTAENGRNILKAGGSGSDNTSIWFARWGDDSLFGIYPQGSKAGLQHHDKGERDAFDADNNRFFAFVDQFKWDAGVVLKDWRFVARICNIDVSNLADNSSPADLTKLMIKAVNRLESLDGKVCIYMNRTVFTYLDLQRYSNVQAGGGITWETVDGKRMAFFREIPIRVTDGLLDTEATVS